MIYSLLNDFRKNLVLLNTILFIAVTSMTFISKKLAFTSGVLFFLLSIPVHVQAMELTDDYNSRIRDLVTSTESDRTKAFNVLSADWDISYVAPLIELITLTSDRAFVAEIVSTLENNTGQSLGFDIQEWFDWLWHQNYEAPAEYAAYKSWLYSSIDPKFEFYFNEDHKNIIRLDEVRWGGVRQDGIPPLRQPKMIAASDAAYLQDDHVVFGVEINSDVRAYPKRILAWHEMFVDDVGGVPVAGVYCTLCGAMIVYETEQGDKNYEMGTSGFLYRSNKLMYDKSTQSLWNTMWGKPVIGPLVDSGVQLRKRSVVTTTWGEWKRRHPETTVLSLDTGHSRNYGEGIAYKEYFATDNLMFTVPDLDQRLLNKDEILGIILPEYPEKPLALSTDFLEKNPIHYESIGENSFVVLTDESGANRVYEAGDSIFLKWEAEQLIDSSGQRWSLEEAKLVREDGGELLRLPAHRSFWFGWYSAYDNTRLVN